jgi:peptidyl-dipeptidase Dcp
VPTYHADAHAYEVADADGRVIGLFVQDNFARAGKRSGAWMSALHWQHRNGFESRPVVLNNNNFARAGDGGPTLLSLDDVRTLFHEFGHGLHGLLSDVRYERLSGTQVLRDFVELPSQLFEHWIDEPQVLKRHAKHCKTGEPIPDELIARVQAARRFGQAYDSVRYTASAMVDMAAHASNEAIDDIVAFERRVLAARGAPAVAGMNHRLPHFQHLFAGSGYAAGYYVYLWAEVLDADAYDAFVEAGDPFDAGIAQRLRRYIYGSGNSIEPGAAYQAFRGRAPRIEPMLRERGLT